MKRFAVCALLSLFAAAPLSAQLPKSHTGSIPSLAELVPETVLGYYRLVDPVGDFEKLMGSGDVWKSPQKVSEKTRRASDKGLKTADKALGIEDGSMDSWLKSIGTIELALYHLDFGGQSGQDAFAGPPMPDFAVIMESPLAIEIYNQVSEMMVNSGIGAKNEGGQMVLGMGGGIAPMFAIYGSKVVLASDQARLDSILSAAKTGVPNSLASSAAFRAVCGDGSGPRIGYMRFGAFADLMTKTFASARSPGPGETAPRQSRIEESLRSLGVYDITAIGYREDGPNGLLSFKSEKPVKLFQLLKGKTGAPALQAALPADTAFSFAHTLDLGPQLRRIEKFVTDKNEFPFASTVITAMTAMTLSMGISTEAFLEPLKEGVSIAMLPDQNGRVRNEDSLVVVAGMSDPEEGAKLLARLSKTFARANKCVIDDTTVDGVRWLKEQPGSRGAAAAAASQPAAPAPAPVDAEVEVEVVDPVPDESGQGEGSVVEVRVGTDSQPTVRRRGRTRFAGPDQRGSRATEFVVAYNGKVLVVGREANVRRALDAHAGKIATLSSTGAFQRLPERATFYSTASLKALFGNSDAFGSAFSFLKDSGAMGFAMTAADDLMTVTFNRAPGQFVNILLGASAVGEDGREVRDQVRDALNEIGARTKAYQAQNKKWPQSLVDLGYAPGKAPAFANDEGKMKSVVFLPPKGESTSWNELLAYWDCSDLGRLCVSGDGFASTWSESRFLTALAKYNTPK